MTIEIRSRNCAVGGLLPFTLLALSLAIAVSATSFAQGVQSGAVRGVVTDQQNRPAPGVKVTATSTALQGPRSTLTDAAGGYLLAALPPGDYVFTLDLAGFTTVTASTAVPLGLTVAQNFSLRVLRLEEHVAVVAAAPLAKAQPVMGANFTQSDIDALATPRTLQGIAQLSPAVSENSPSANQIVINGAFAFDNIFMIDGVDVNDNLRAQPQNLFIEDAIQETQVLTSGISAEYGRFTGGVVNAITKGGGNRLAGTFRLNFFNPAWTEETPYEQAQQLSRLEKLQQISEGTLGGPLAQNRLWFFGAGRLQRSDASNTLPVTGIPYTQTTNNTRGEIKLTGTVVPSHSVQGGYVSNKTTTLNGSGALSFIVDPHSLDVVSVPNWYAFTNYRGVAGGGLLLEAQYSERRFKTGGGNNTTSLVDSPFFSVLGLGPYMWNAPYFDASDPEERNNRQLTASVTTNWNRAGRHDMKSGYEFFRSQRAGGGSQSPTDVVFYADFATTAAGAPVIDASGRLIPLFEPGTTAIDFVMPMRGAVMNVDTNTAYVQDHWAINTHWLADIGVRYEHTKAVSTGGIVGVDNHRIVPRVAGAFDVRGDGGHVIRGTYGAYSGRYNESQIGGNSPVVAAPELLVFYSGPAGQGRDFASGFDLANYPVTPDNAVVLFPPPTNVSMDPNLKSPLTHEVTASYDTAIGRRMRGNAAYVFRKTTGLIEDFQTVANGFTELTFNDIDAGPVTNQVYRNSSQAHREYQALVFQSSYRLSAAWMLDGHYTLQLKNHGNYEGETSAIPGATSKIGDYPEAFSAARFYPDGRLQNFERQRLRVWSVHNFTLPRVGNVSASGLWRVDSGRVYSLTANVPISKVQRELLNAAGYVDYPTPNVVYFGDRGSQSFNGYALFDASVNIGLRAFESLRPWVKFDVFNVFNNQKLVSWNTTVRADPNSPTDSLGLPTGYTKGPLFGQATSTSNFPAPFNGTTGGRTVRVSVGIRF